MTGGWHDRVAAFRQASLACLTSDAARHSGGELAAECHEMARLLARVAGPVGPAQPVVLPAARFLRPALAGVTGTGLQDLARAAAALADGLHWRNKYQNSDARLYDRFAFCDLIGPDGVQPSEEVTLGLVIVGPQTRYPLHHHPARELYLVLAGTAGWAVDDRPLAPLAPGALILHREMQPHAMQTGPETLVALSLWRGDIRSPSRFSTSGPQAPGSTTT